MGTLKNMANTPNESQINQILHNRCAIILNFLHLYATESELVTNTVNFFTMVLSSSSQELISELCVCGIIDKFYFVMMNHEKLKSVCLWGLSNIALEESLSH